MRTGGRVALLYVQQPAEFQHWMAVGDLMREEAREEAEGLMQKLSAEVKEWSGNYPVVHMREGDIGDELEKLLDEEESISVLVLAASTESAGPGPLISHLVGKGGARLRVPVTIVPGSLTMRKSRSLIDRIAVHAISTMRARVDFRPNRNNLLHPDRQAYPAGEY